MRFTVGFDEAEHRYYVIASDIPGLHVETETFEEFVEVVQDVMPDLVGSIGFRVMAGLDPASKLDRRACRRSLGLS